MSRQIAYEVIYNVFEKGAFSNIALDSALRKSDINNENRALVTEIVYGTLKYKYTIDTILDEMLERGVKKTNKKVVTILRMALYQIIYLDKIPPYAVVNESVELVKKNGMGKSSKLVNGVLREFIRRFEKDSELEGFNKDKSNIGKLSYKYSFPKWMTTLIVGQYGEIKGEEILKGLNERPGVTVRVNGYQYDYDTVYAELEEAGYTVEEGTVCPEAITIKRGRGITSNPLFIKGAINVQDESAMLVAPSMELREGNNVIDMCSAPGGKTCHIGEILNNTGNIKAFDIYEEKLALIRSNAERSSLTNITPQVGNGEVFNEELEEWADNILIDVPCSGLGIIRKKPEIKWTKSKNDLKEIVKIQKNIMKNAAKYVKVGGEILYSTCTINRTENEENVRWFLSTHKNFKIEPVYFGDVNNIIYSKEGCATILPNDKMDGFFICKLRRES